MKPMDPPAPTNAPHVTTGAWRAAARPALTLLPLLTLLCGVVYPAVVTGVAQLAFPWRANGSLLFRGNEAVGSALIGQPFDAPAYIWSRPASTEIPYDGAASGGSNLGPSNPALAARIGARLQTLHAADPSAPARVPVDLVTASGSGLDPAVSPAAAFYQARRVAVARGVPVEQVDAVIRAHIIDRPLGFLGDPCVNVLELNLALDQALPGPAGRP